MSDRLQKCVGEQDHERHISALPPVARGGLLIIPSGLLRRLESSAPVTGFAEPGWSTHPVARAEIERLEMEAVMAAEIEAGHEPEGIAKEKRGFDM